MTPDERTQPSNLILQTELKGLGDKINDIKVLLVGYEERIRCLERTGDSRQPVIEQRIEILEKTSEEHEKDLKSLKALIDAQTKNIDALTDSLGTVRSILKWILGIFTVAFTAVMILFLTGQAQVIFK